MQFLDGKVQAIIKKKVNSISYSIQACRSNFATVCQQAVIRVLVDCLHIFMAPQYTEYDKLCKYMATNPKPTLLRVSRHKVTKLLILSRMSKM